MTIRTRYAPSPTGYLHVGGLRTALYNYLFGRQHGGVFVLRIEDTDQTRKVEGAVESLLGTLAWIGLDFDEGPFVGGPYGPYVQSERLAIYLEHVEKLKAGGNVYPCFCTSEELEKMRAHQAHAGVVPMYDRRCRKIDPATAQARLDAGEPHVWRMKVPDHRTVAIQDLIRGEVKIDTSSVDDQVLIKSDGFPTYHLANVVDDHLMHISHVIRGEEWLPSTPKHILLYEFLGWEIPKFAHLPLLLNPDRSKMSKRVGDVAVEDYRRKGILPQVLLNFVALLGWHPQDEKEMFTLGELIREFSFERVNRSGAVFDMTKLLWMNAEYIKTESVEELFAHVRSQIEDLIEANGEARVKYASEVLRGGAHTYLELAEKIQQVFAPLESPDPEMAALLDDKQVVAMVGDFAAKMQALPEDVWDDFKRLEVAFKAAATEAGQAHGLKGKHLWMGLRAALTGQPHGPELGKLVGIWGRDRVLAQLHQSTESTV